MLSPLDLLAHPLKVLCRDNARHSDEVEFLFHRNFIDVYDIVRLQDRELFELIRWDFNGHVSMDDSVVEELNFDFLVDHFEHLCLDFAVIEAHFVTTSEDLVKVWAVNQD